MYTFNGNVLTCLMTLSLLYTFFLYFWIQLLIHVKDNHSSILKHIPISYRMTNIKYPDKRKKRLLYFKYLSYKRPGIHVYIF